MIAIRSTARPLNYDLIRRLTTKPWDHVNVVVAMSNPVFKTGYQVTNFVHQPTNVDASFLLLSNIALNRVVLSIFLQHIIVDRGYKKASDAME